MMVSDPPLPIRLEPGDPAYAVTAPLHQVKRRFMIEPPRWAWAEDAYGNIVWASLGEDVRRLIRSTNRKKRVQTRVGDLVEVEIEDDEPLADDE